MPVRETSRFWPPISSPESAANRDFFKAFSFGKIRVLLRPSVVFVGTAPAWKDAGLGSDRGETSREETPRDNPLFFRPGVEIQTGAERRARESPANSNHRGGGVLGGGGGGYDGGG
jgi:hypothetical protein